MNWRMFRMSNNATYAKYGYIDVLEGFLNV